MFTWFRVIVAIVLAAGAAAATFLSVQRTGDPQAVIDQAERQLNDVNAILQRHTFELKDASAPNPTDKSRTLYRISGPKGELLFLDGPANRDANEIGAIAAELFSSSRDRYLAANSAWAEVRGISTNLLPSNRRIAEAKALRQFDTKPDAALQQQWASRFPDGNESWRIEELTQFETKRVMYAVAAGLASFAIVMFVLALWSRVMRSVRGVQSTAAAPR